MGWRHQFWRISHAEVGSFTDGYWVLNLASWLGIAVASPFHTSADFFPSGNVRRVPSSKISNGQPVSTPLAVYSSLVDTLFPLGIVSLFFTVPSVFSLSDWCRHRLS